MMFQMGPIRFYQSRFQPGRGIDRQPVPSDGSGVATSTFTRLAAASVLAIRSLIRALVALALVSPAVLLETSIQSDLGQPHIHHHIIDHKRIDAGNSGSLGVELQGTFRIARPFAQQTEARAGQDFPRCGRARLGSGIDRHGFALGLDLSA
jgi:hypothetical protein